MTSYEGAYDADYADEDLTPTCADIITTTAFVEQVAATTRIHKRKVTQVLAAAAVLLDAQGAP